MPVLEGKWMIFLWLRHVIDVKIEYWSDQVMPDSARRSPLGRSMEAISNKHILTEKSKVLPSKPYLCLHLFKNSKAPVTTCRQLGGSDRGGQSK